MSSFIRFFYSIFIVFFMILAAPAHAISPYEIRISLKNYPDSYLMVGTYFGKTTLMLDTIVNTKSGEFTFKGNKRLEAGMYFFRLFKRDALLHFLVTSDNQHFTIEADAKILESSAKATNSPENEAYFYYNAYLLEREHRWDELEQDFKNAKDATLKKRISNEMNRIGDEMNDFPKQFLREHPNSFAGNIVKLLQNAEIRDKKQYFDNIEMTDERLIRTPIFLLTVEYFIKKRTPQQPDSINIALDKILSLAEPNKTSYLFFLEYFLNEYGKNDIIGFDACFVHLAEKYVKNKPVPSGWSQEDYQKVVQKSAVWSHILIGKIAPDLVLMRQNGTSMHLHDIKANYTVLIFWKPDCDQCHETLPKIVNFYEKYKMKGVEIVAVCTKLGENVSKCWDMIAANAAYQQWINVADSLHQSRCQTIYDVKFTPQIFVLDSNKKIITKGIAANDIGASIDLVR